MKSQRSHISLAMVAVLVCLVSTAGFAVEPYSQDFEFLFQPDPDALINEGWLVYGNVFQPDGTYIYGYGPFGAPNDGFAFCQIDLDQGGPEQGFQQLVVFSDYNNAAHAAGNLVESNVYIEQTIGAADVGTGWTFQFDAKRGNIAGGSTAIAFIKTIDPSSGYATTNFVTVDMTAIPETWATYSISLAIGANLEGQLFQFGFANTATLYESSGIFYDNISFALGDMSPVPDVSAMAGAKLGQNYPNPFNPMTRIDFALDRPGTVELGVFNLAGRKIATLVQGSLAEGDHHVIWNGMTDSGSPAPSGHYSYVLQTASGQVSRSLVLLK